MLSFEESFIAENEDESSNKPSGCVRERERERRNKKKYRWGGGGGLGFFSVGILGFVLVERLRMDPIISV